MEESTIMTIIGFLVAALGAVTGWLLKKVISDGAKIVKLETEVANLKTTVHEDSVEFKTEIKEVRKEVRDGFEKVYEKLDKRIGQQTRVMSDAVLQAIRNAKSD